VQQQHRLYAEWPRRLTADHAHLGANFVATARPNSIRPQREMLRTSSETPGSRRQPDVGVCRRLAETMPDRRDPDYIQHQMVEMVTARVTAIACGHEDAIDRYQRPAACDRRNRRTACLSRG
jgi:hypothetical protein